jgi:hypothetical protein
MTLVGEVPQGTLTVSLPDGYSLVSSIVPQAVPLTAASNFPLSPLSQFSYFNALTQNFDPPLICDGTAWFLFDGTSVPPPTPPVGTGFFYFNATGATSTWTRNFSVN